MNLLLPVLEQTFGQHRGWAAITAASQQEGSFFALFQWDSSVWNLHVLTITASL